MKKILALWKKIPSGIRQFLIMLGISALKKKLPGILPPEVTNNGKK